MKNDPSVIKQKAQEITAKCKDDLQKIKAVLYWVHNNIRYVAFEDGIAGFKPDEAQNVLKKKYGDCKGMANLTKELLTSLGFDARLTWIGTNHIAYDYSTPSLCVDNHMICCLNYKGQRYFLDGTESFLPFSQYAERIQGRQVLIENGDNYILDHVPTTTWQQNLCSAKEDMSIRNEELFGPVTYLYHGESKEELMSGIHAVKNDKLNTVLELYLTNNNKNYQATGITYSDLNETEGDLSIKFSAVNKGAVSLFDKDMYIDVDYNKTFNKTSIDTNRYAKEYRFAYKYNYETETNLEIPAGYKVSTLPANLDYDDPNFHFSISFKQINNKISYKKHLYISNTLLKRDAITSWNKAVAVLTEKYTEQIILTKNQP
jgi:hypothetical protein